MKLYFLLTRVFLVQYENGPEADSESAAKFIEQYVDDARQKCLSAAVRHARFVDLKDYTGDTTTCEFGYLVTKLTYEHDPACFFFP